VSACVPTNDADDDTSSSSSPNNDCLIPADTYVVSYVAIVYAPAANVLILHQPYQSAQELLTRLLPYEIRQAHEYVRRMLSSDAADPSSSLQLPPWCIWTHNLRRNDETGNAPTPPGVFVSVHHNHRVYCCVGSLENGHHSMGDALKQLAQERCNTDHCAAQTPYDPDSMQVEIEILDPESAWTTVANVDIPRGYGYHVSCDSTQQSALFLPDVWHSFNNSSSTYLSSLYAKAGIDPTSTATLTLRQFCTAKLSVLL